MLQGDHPEEAQERLAHQGADRSESEQEEDELRNEHEGLEERKDRDCYAQLTDVLEEDYAFKATQMNKLSTNLPQEHVVRARS